MVLCVHYFIYETSISMIFTISDSVFSWFENRQKLVFLVVLERNRQKRINLYSSCDEHNVILWHQTSLIHRKCERKVKNTPQWIYSGQFKTKRTVNQINVYFYSAVLACSFKSFFFICFLFMKVINVANIEK